METVEVAHEALIRNWKRLRGWLKEDRAFLLWRERLGAALDAWEANNKADRYLLNEGPLAEAARWIPGRFEDLSEAEKELINHSQSQQDRIRRQRARMKVLVSVGIILSVLLVAIIVLYNRRRNELKAKFLFSEARQLQGRALDRALLLALEAQRLHDAPEERGLIPTLLEQTPFLDFFLPSDGRTVYQVAFSPDGRWLGGAGVSPPVFFDARSGRRLPLTIGGRDVFGVAFGPGGKAATSNRKTIQMWDLATAEPGLSIPLTWRVRNLTFSPNGRLIAASRNEEIRLWDTASGKHYGAPLEVDGPWVSGFAFSPDGRTLAAADASETIELWDVATGRTIPSVQKAGQSFLSVAFSPDGRRLVSGEGGGKLRLWDAFSVRPLGESCAGHSGDVLDVAFDSISRDGVWTLASAGSDGRIFLWDVPAGEGSEWNASNCTPRAALTGHGGTVWSLAFGRDGLLLSGGENKGLILWRLSRVPRLAQPLPGPEGLRSFAYSPDGRWIAAGTSNGELALWDARNLMQPTVVQAHRSETTSIAFRQDGAMIACGDKSGRVLVWDLASGLRRQPERSFVPSDLDAVQGVWSVAFDPEGARLAVGFGNGLIRIWDVNTGVVLHDLYGHSQSLISSLAFSRDGRQLVAGGDDRHVHIWDLTTLKEAQSHLEGHSQAVGALAFSRDGHLLASSGSDKIIQIWDVRGGYSKLGPPLVGPEDIVAGVAFSPDGKTLAAVSLDGSIFLWNVDSRSPIVSSLRGREGAVALSFDPTGDRLVTADSQGLLLWDLRFESWRKLACATVRRNLTKDEWREYMENAPYRKTCPDFPEG